MATRTKTTTISQLPDEEHEISLSSLPQQLMTEDEITAEEQLQNVLAELGGESDAKVNVYRVEPGKDNAFVGSFEPSIFSVENLQMTYGEGDYLVHVRSNGRIMTRRKIRIAKPLHSGTGLPIQIQQNNDTPKLVETMQAGFTQMAQAMASALAQISNNAPKPKTTLETLQELQMMKSIMGESGNNQVNAMEQFLKGVEFAKEITPREGDIGTMELLKSGLETLAPIIQAGVNRQNVAQIPPPIPLIPNPQHFNQFEALTPDSPQLPVDQSMEVDEMQLMEKMYLNTLVRNAAADNDPMTYANMSLDILGVETALQYAQHPDFFKTLCEKIPEAANFQPWFMEFQAAVIEVALNEKEQPMQQHLSPLTTVNNASTTFDTVDGESKDAISGNDSNT